MTPLSLSRYSFRKGDRVVVTDDGPEAFRGELATVTADCEGWSLGPNDHVVPGAYDKWPDGPWPIFTVQSIRKVEP